MTSIGANSLRIELDKLKKIDRPRIIAAIAEARAHGDQPQGAAARVLQGGPALAPLRKARPRRPRRPRRRRRRRRR